MTQSSFRKASAQFSRLEKKEKAEDMVPSAVRDGASLAGRDFGSCFLFCTQLVALNILGSWDCQPKIVRRQQLSKSIYLGSKHCNLEYTELSNNPNGTPLGSKIRLYKNKNKRNVYKEF